MKRPSDAFEQLWRELAVTITLTLLEKRYQHEKFYDILR
jgi:hypothetical protein